MTHKMLHSVFECPGPNKVWRDIKKQDVKIYPYTPAIHRREIPVTPGSSHDPTIS